MVSNVKCVKKKLLKGVVDVNLSGIVVESVNLIIGLFIKLLAL